MKYLFVFGIIFAFAYWLVGIKEDTSDWPPEWFDDDDWYADEKEQWALWKKHSARLEKKVKGKQKC